MVRRVPPRYPPAERQPVVDVLHGTPVPDPYRWLEDADSPATAAWTAAQEHLLATERAAWSRRDAFRDRLADLLSSGSISAPTWRGERRFFVRRDPDAEHGALLTVDASGTERVLVDPMGIDPSGTTTLDAWQPSKEGALVAYQLSHGGTEESELYVLDAATGVLVEGPIDRARYSPVAWLPGGQAYYYVRRLPPDLVPADEAQYHRRVYLHRLAADPEHDVEVFGAGMDPATYYGVSTSRDGRWLVVTASRGTAPRTDVWIADLHVSAPEAPHMAPLQVGVDARTSAQVGRDGRLYVWTDRDAPRGRLCTTAPEQPGAESWTDLVPQNPEAVLDDFAILDGPELDQPVLLVAWTLHAVAEVSVHDLATGERLSELTLPGIGAIGPLHERPEGGHEAWFGYTDHATPAEVLHYDARDRRLSTWATAPGAVEVPAVRSLVLTATSADGTPVRMFALAPASGDASNDGPDRPRPTILYGYGGFGIPMTPAYSATLLAWVEAGGVYVVACLRGGGEEGEDWHRAGMAAHKQNVFDDFAACAEHLIARGWTTRAQLGSSGGSNGGLLVGAALTQRPDLYRAVVCSAPLLDMVRYEHFGLGATWNEEYGTAADPEQLGWLLAYSPYHCVRDGVSYPATLFTVFAGDTRVDTLHARKMCAALQHADPAGGPFLYREETDVGHGARAVSRQVDLSADVLGFLAAELGLVAPQ